MAYRLVSTSDSPPATQRIKFRLQELDNRDMYLTQLIKSFNPKKLRRPVKLDSGPPLDVNDAAVLLQRCERGRQARESLRARTIAKKQRQLADRRNRSGVAITHEMAAVKIQSALRGMLWRRSIRKEADEVRTLTKYKCCTPERQVFPQPYVRTIQQLTTSW